MRSGPKTTFYYFIKELVIQSTDNKNSRLPKAEHVINQHIPYKKVFVFDQNNEKLGEMQLHDALNLALWKIQIWQKEKTKSQ